MRASNGLMWLRRIGVAALLAAPIAVVLLVAWPASGSGIDLLDTDQDGGELAVGDELDGDLAFRGRVTYELVGTGDTVTVGVRGDGIDTTLTALRADGEQLDHVDDVNGLDPELTVDVDDGDRVLFVVRELGGTPGAFTIYAEAGGAAPGEEVDGGELAVGAAADGEVAREGVVRYRLVGTGGSVTVGVEAKDDLDPTVTVLDDIGSQVAYNDDAFELDPEVTFTLDEGEVVTVEVRDLGQRSGEFTVYADAGDVGRRGERGGNGGSGGGRPVPETTIPVED